MAARFPPSEALPLHFEVRAEGKEEEEEGKGLWPISSRSVSSALSNRTESECILEEEEKPQVLIVPLSHSNHRLAVKIMLTYWASNWASTFFAGGVRPSQA